MISEYKLLLANFSGDSVRARFVAGTATPLLSVSIRRLSAATASSSARPVHSALTTSAVVTARESRDPRSWPRIARSAPSIPPMFCVWVHTSSVGLSHGRDRGGGWSFSSASASASSEHGCA